MRFILGLFALLFIRPILYLLKGLWFVLEFCFMILVVKMILGTVRWMKKIHLEDDPLYE